MASTGKSVPSMLFDLRVGPDMQKHKEVRQQMIEALKSIKPTEKEAPFQERRRQVHEKSIQIARLGILKSEYLRDDFGKWSMAVSPMVSWDLGVLTKLVIHFQLFGGTLVELGTERHGKWIEAANRGDYIGGFAMTEIGHGSNVQAIETRADFDPVTQEFVLTSPTPTSYKFMIGNVGIFGQVIVLMAQLYMGDGEKKGVHAFVVRLRDDQGRLLDGVDLGDVGLKSSWNEVDNAWIAFRGMRIPRENLLNAYASIEQDGSYQVNHQALGWSSSSSPSSVASKLFAATMAQLLVGRINYIGAPIIGMQIALHTAIRYALARRQFGSGGGGGRRGSGDKKSAQSTSPASSGPSPSPTAPSSYSPPSLSPFSSSETPIIHYTTHYTRLMDFLAKTIALQFARNYIISRLAIVKGSASLDSSTPSFSSNGTTATSNGASSSTTNLQLSEYHALISGLKAYVCEWAYISLGHLRVMTGGAGIVLENGIGALHNYFDVFQTAEGDRTVLYQQLGKQLVSTASAKYKGLDGLSKFASEVFAQLLVQYNPILSMVEDNSFENLSSSGFLLKSLQLRQITTLRDLISKMQSLATAAHPQTPSAIWNDCLLDVISVSNAYIESFVFQQCYNQVSELKQKLASSPSNSSEHDTLSATYRCIKAVSAVVGLGFIKEDIQFYMRSGFFSSKRCHFIEQSWIAMCLQLKEHHIEDLLASSELVMDLYHAPQGQEDGNYASHLIRAMKPSQAKL